MTRHVRTAAFALVAALLAVAAWQAVPGSLHRAAGQPPAVEQREAAPERRAAGSQAQAQPVPTAQTPAEYAAGFKKINDDLDLALVDFRIVVRRGWGGQDIQRAIRSVDGALAAFADGARRLTPPPCYEETHRALLYAAGNFDYYVRTPFPTGATFEAGDVFLIEARRQFDLARC